jgi:hypothetical protein
LKARPLAVEDVSLREAQRKVLGDDDPAASL